MVFEKASPEQQKSSSVWWLSIDMLSKGDMHLNYKC